MHCHALPLMSSVWEGLSRRQRRAWKVNWNFEQKLRCFTSMHTFALLIVHLLRIFLFLVITFSLQDERTDSLSVTAILKMVFSFYLDWRNFIPFHYHWPFKIFQGEVPGWKRLQPDFAETKLTTYIPILQSIIPAKWYSLWAFPIPENS